MRPKLYTTDSQVSDKKIIIRGLILTAGAVDVVCYVYNEATSAKTASKLVMVLQAPANTSFEVANPIMLDEGCYLDVAGTNPQVTILR